MSAETVISTFKQYPTLILCGVLSVVVLVAIVVRGGGISDARERLDELTREGQRMDQNISHSVDLERHVAELRGMMGDVSARLVRSSELARNLQYFYRFESETGVSITSLDQRGRVEAGDDDEDDDGAYVPVRYELAIEGGFPDILEFVYRIENGRHFARFNQFEIVRGQRTDSMVMRMAMNLELLGRP